MTVTLTMEKKSALVILCKEILSKNRITIRQLSRLLGKISSSFLGTPFGRLHYRALERQKSAALKRSCGNFDKYTILSGEASLEIQWWITNTMESFAPITRDNPVITMTTDASTIGWGASLNGTVTGGQFNIIERQDHINVLETKASCFALKSLCREVTDTHILLKIDNTSAVACINKMGSTRSITMDKVSKLIWKWARDTNN